MSVPSSLAIRPALRAIGGLKLLLAGVLLAGCGQKGPLVLPQPDHPTPASSAASAAPTR